MALYNCPITGPVQPQQAIPDYTLAIVGMGIAIILAVAIVGVLLFRKKA
jgi:hypothetical protein